MNFHNYQKVFLLVLFLATLPFACCQAETVSLKIDGRITTETLKEFNKALSEIEKNHQTIILNAVQLNSFGGSGSVAKEIGKIIRQKKLNTYVAKESNCDSACVDILIAGVQRYAFGEIGVHRTTFATDIRDDKYVKPFIDETVKLNAEYVKSMGISMMLSDAMESTESWRIRSLSETEKRQWQVFGTDRLEEELLFNQIARERNISRNEFIDIFKSRYDECLKEAEQLKFTIFECARTQTKKPASLSYQLFSWLNNKLDAYAQADLPAQPYNEKIIEIINKIRSNEIYLRYMSVTSTKNQRIKLQNQLSTKEIEEMEKKNIWWTSNNTINVLVTNPSLHPLNEIQFNLSTDDCQTKGNEFVLSMSLLANLESKASVVYSGELPFNYVKVIGKGTRCGTIKAAYFLK